MALLKVREAVGSGVLSGASTRGWEQSCGWGRGRRPSRAGSRTVLGSAPSLTPVGAGPGPTARAPPNVPLGSPGGRAPQFEDYCPKASIFQLGA